ncbi:MAG TPA: response regulator [Opitutaceae bacterium]|jgi:CheY-like chemotaxis protein|nr:response regulator [Opitutaceae bacterium]
MRILIAEDDKVSRELLRRMLESDGRHALTLAGDGTEAWSHLLDPSQAFDACILDIQMPGIDGLELAERIRAHARLAKLPIVLCTAANDRATVQRAAAFSVCGYFVKPYTRDRVLAKLKQIEGELPATPAQREPLENVANVCRRLGIDGETHKALLHATLADIREWSGHFRAEPAGAEVEKLLVRANGLKGACLSLGAMQAAQKLADFLARRDEETLAALDQAVAALTESVGLPAAA